MVDRLDSLGHDAVVGGDDDHRDIRDLGAAGAHRRECGMTRRVDEGDGLAIALDLVGADVLGDAAGLARDDVGLADGVEQAGLAVVDVAENGHDGRAGGGGLLGFLVVGADGGGDGPTGILARWGDAQLGGNDGGRVVVDGVVHGGHDAVRHEPLDGLDGGDAKALAEPLDGDRLRQRDGARTGRLSGGHASSAPF